MFLGLFDGHKALGYGSWEVILDGHKALGYG